MREIVSAFGKIDILINNAGIVLPGRVDNMSEEDFDRTMRINVKGVFFVARQPMGRLGKVEEIAHAIIFACCDEAAYMNGSIISIDGGMTI